MQNESGTSHVRDAILQYLQRNPDAADTLRGVMSWWLPAQFHEKAEKDVEQAMERLVAQGDLTKTVLVDGSILYAGTAGRESRSSGEKAGKSK